MSQILYQVNNFTLSKFPNFQNWMRIDNFWFQWWAIFFNFLNYLLFYSYRISLVIHFWKFNVTVNDEMLIFWLSITFYSYMRAKVVTYHIIVWGVWDIPYHELEKCIWITVFCSFSIVLKIIKIFHNRNNLCHLSTTYAEIIAIGILLRFFFCKYWRINSIIQAMMQIIMQTLCEWMQIGKDPVQSRIAPINGPKINTNTAFPTMCHPNAAGNFSNEEYSLTVSVKLLSAIPRKNPAMQSQAIIEDNSVCSARTVMRLK